MSNLLYYPNAPLSVSDIAERACQQPAEHDQLAQRIATVNHCQNMDDLRSRSQPIIIPGREDPRCLSAPHLTLQEHRHLGAMAASIGGARVMGIADLLQQTKVLDHIGNAGTFLGGASAGSITASNHVLKAIDKYAKVVAEYDAYKKNSGVPNTLRRIGQRRQQAFREMNHVLNQKGVNFLNKHAFKTRQVPDSRGRIVSESIPINNHAEVQALKRFAQKARYVGKGLIVLDAGLRVNSVYQHHQAGKDWKREAVVQGAGFGMGLLAASALITIISVATPLGLVMVIAAAGATALGIDILTKAGAGKIYDGLVK